MQTISIEFRTPELEQLGLVPRGVFDRYEEVELLETVRLERDRRVQLLRLRRHGPLPASDDLGRDTRRLRRRYGLESVEVVERRPKTRELVVLVRQRNPPALKEVLELAGGEISPTAPFRLTATTVLATFLGGERSLRRVVKWLDRVGLAYRVVRSSRRPYLAEPDRADLTRLQADVLTRAVTLGYYAIPRRITLTRLARHLGRSPPAVGKILRRAEGRLALAYLARASDRPPDARPAEPARQV